MYTLDEQLKAAYALNLCKISISQIIDYNDINILEQEYENILNNLNLEQIPKDEALLDTLREILDTITYYKISEGDKKMIDAKYQHKMKNAVWSSIPRMGMIFASGNPIAIAVTLAAQVGIGYMNYRRNKAEYQFGKEEEYWQLSRGAMDRINGLQKQFFTTAWRLADEYNFPDEFRLTEDQIQEYNAILMESSPYKRYTRLEMIQDHFAAYPQFWYQIGSTANTICHDVQLNDDMKAEYKNLALNYFERYRQLNKFNLLRNDVFTSAWALEYIDLLDLREPENIEKARELAATAEKYAGNAMDILELCAYAQLKIGNHDRAAKLFNLLVAKDYNVEINARILSGIYINKLRSGSNEALNDYKKLTLLTNKNYLLPLPEPDEEWAPEWTDTNTSTSEDATKEPTDLKEITISRIQHIAQGEKRIYRHKIIHFNAMINCEGALEFDNCVLHYNESESADEISLTDDSTLTMRNCTVINHGYDEHFFIETNGPGKREIGFENCEFVSCCYFLSSNRNIRFEQCKMLDIGNQFLKCWHGTAVIRECEFQFLKEPIFFTESKQDIISLYTAEITECIVKGTLQILSSESAEKIAPVGGGPYGGFFLNLQYGSITNSSFFGIKHILNVQSYSDDLVINRCIFEHCVNCICSGHISSCAIKLSDCRFDNCTRICMSLGKGSKISYCQFNECYSELLSADDFKDNIVVYFCEFNNWQAPQRQEEIALFAGGMMRFWRCKGKDGRENCVKNCSFNGVLAHNYFLITASSVDQLNGPVVRVEKCSFQNCVTERSSKKLIREYDTYSGMFNKLKEQRVTSISDCRGLDRINTSGSQAENVTKKDKSSTGEAIGAMLGAAITAGVPGMLAVKVIQNALEDEITHNE